MTIETNDSDKMNAAVDYILEHSTVKSNGVREVRKADFIKALETYGVNETDYKKSQDAVDFLTTAAARVSLADVENKISSASKDDLENEDYRKSLTSTVRLPTFGGATEVECRAEKISPIPFRNAEDGDDKPTVKVTHGSFRTTINTKGRIYKDLHEESANRIRSALGMS